MSANPNLSKYQFQALVKADSMDTGLNLVRGWAVVSSVDGRPYIDLHDDYIPQGPLLKAAIAFMRHSRMSDDMHDERPRSVVVESVVIDDGWCEAFGATLDKRGWAVGIQFPPDIFAKFQSGEYTGFSIGGRLITASAVEDGVCPECKEKIAQCSCTDAMKAARGVASGGQNFQKSIQFEDFVVNFISSVDWPAQEYAQAVQFIKSKNSPKNLQTETDSGRSQDMDELAKAKQRIAQLESLTADQMGYFKSLTTEADRDAFLAKLSPERDSLTKAWQEADAVVHTCHDGTEIRKSAGPVALALAKQNDKLAKDAEDAREIAKGEKLVKRAETELAALPDEIGVKVAYLEAVDTIKNADMRGKVLTMVQKGIEALKTLGKSDGVDGEPPRRNDNGATVSNLEKAQAEYLAGIEAYMEKKKVSKAVAFAEFGKTKEGIPLVKALEDARAGVRNGPRMSN